MPFRCELFPKSNGLTSSDRAVTVSHAAQRSANVVLSDFLITPHHSSSYHAITRHAAQRSANVVLSDFLVAAADRAATTDAALAAVAPLPLPPAMEDALARATAADNADDNNAGADAETAWRRLRAPPGGAFGELEAGGERAAGVLSMVKECGDYIKVTTARGRKENRQADRQVDS